LRILFAHDLRPTKGESMISAEPFTISPDQYDAVILDLDGVITRTAAVHARAWKEMFDEYLESREESYEPLDIRSDYRKYIDGKPRYDGVQSFLESRGISLPYGSPEDSPDTETVCGLGNRKNELFREIIHRDGVEVFEDTVVFLHTARDNHMKTGVISSSKNCREILETADLLQLFDTRIDGVVSKERGIPGKPEPDVFLEAARELDTTPSRAIVFEDAIAGVQAGKDGEFGLVIGVAREGGEDRLLNNGADLTIRKFDELKISEKE